MTNRIRRLVVTCSAAVIAGGAGPRPQTTQAAAFGPCLEPTWRCVPVCDPMACQAPCLTMIDCQYLESPCEDYTVGLYKITCYI